ncbi:hypothetical protein TNCV_856601 [Trichonephila clavipes]|nr:hypothetical protein TNCV_856601 [Trichonephila clavipes]
MSTMGDVMCVKKNRQAVRVRPCKRYRQSCSNIVSHVVYLSMNAGSQKFSEVAWWLGMLEVHLLLPGMMLVNEEQGNVQV